MFENHVDLVILSKSRIEGVNLSLIHISSKETAPKKEPAQKTGKTPAPKKAEKESEAQKEPLKKEVSKEPVSVAPPEKTAGKTPEKPKGAPRRGKEQIVYIKLGDLCLLYTSRCV